MPFRKGREGARKRARGAALPDTDDVPITVRASPRLRKQLTLGTVSEPPPVTMLSNAVEIQAQSGSFVSKMHLLSPHCHPNTCTPGRRGELDLKIIRVIRLALGVRSRGLSCGKACEL